MDFFAAQDHARKTSRKLVIGFVVAVVVMIATVYAVAVAAFSAVEANQSASSAPQGALSADAGSVSLWQPELFAMVAIGVGGFILLGSLFKVLALARDGGARIARELGGRLVSRASDDPRERQLINVVDEMAIASGIPAPPVYVLDAEGGINAFAAGMKPGDSVIGVTRGALEQFSRDELQGVIAHEFSHILNGDMRLNLRLIGLLHGILLLALGGRMLMFSARRSDRNAAPIVLTGLALIIVGYGGVVIGKLIKAAVSRQREFLADASAVQFTRNSAGIGGALKRIAGIGSGLQHPRAEQASHMFFGSCASFSSLLATHPPIDERIRRIDPALMGDAEVTAPTPPPGPDPASGTAGLAGFSPEAYTRHMGNITDQDLSDTHALLQTLPEALAHAAHRPRGARAVLFALLLSRQEPTRSTQLSQIEQDFCSETRAQTEAHAATLDALPEQSSLPVLDLTLPTLRELAGTARLQLVETVDKLIEADQRTSLFEFVVRRLLHANLELLPQTRPSARRLRHDATRLLALLARAGETTHEMASHAYGAAIPVTGLSGDWPPLSEIPDDIAVKELDLILDHLGGTTPTVRKRLVHACATAVTHDGKITPAQQQLLRAICQALDCPAPLR